MVSWLLKQLQLLAMSVVVHVMINVFVSWWNSFSVTYRYSIGIVAEIVLGMDVGVVESAGLVPVSEVEANSFLVEVLVLFD